MLEFENTTSAMTAADKLLLRALNIAGIQPLYLVDSDGNGGTRLALHSAIILINGSQWPPAGALWEQTIAWAEMVTGLNRESITLMGYPADPSPGEVLATSGNSEPPPFTTVPRLNRVRPYGIGVLPYDNETGGESR